MSEKVRNVLKKVNEAPIKLQLFVGEPYHFTIHSDEPLINVNKKGKTTFNTDQCFINIQEDGIELKLKFKKENIDEKS